MDKFFLLIEKAHAVASKTVGGFVVHAGSTAMVDGSPFVKRDRPLRDKLVRDGVLVPHRDLQLLRFSRDYVFDSPSAAAGVVKDGNSSGTNDWRDTVTGKKMSEI
ncbi:DUF4357 domain-containing protein [Marinibacterium sp. SX1]|uniref:DUF4357 domain-containing protein n=1 Tax=Marinibacterium sp. SX1 TaxID=3388424 RepID=UPI003D17CAFC